MLKRLATGTLHAQKEPAYLWIIAPLVLLGIALACVVYKFKRGKQEPQMHDDEEGCPDTFQYPFVVDVRNHALRCNASFKSKRF